MHVYSANRRGLNWQILRPLWLMTSAAADVISVPGVYNGYPNFSQNGLHIETGIWSNTIAARQPACMWKAAINL